MAITLQNLIDQTQSDCGFIPDPRQGAMPQDWVRWACNGITEVLSNIAPEYCIQPDLSVVENVFWTEDPNSEIPLSLQNKFKALCDYLEYRYHSLAPKNSEEREAAGECYARFLSQFGIQAGSR